MLERVISVVAPNAKFIPQPPPRWSGKAFRTVANSTSKRERHPSDYYSTPYPITRLLLDAETFPDHILEPAVGEARAIEAVLIERGHKVTSFDINGRGKEQRCFFEVDERYPAIITNPPFRLATEFMEHAKRIADEKVAMLLPLNNLTGFDRYQRLWNDTAFPLARVYVLNRGVNFLQDPTLEQLGPSQMYSAWMIFERTHIGSPTIHWLNNQLFMGRKASTRVETIDDE